MEKRALQLAAIVATMILAGQAQAAIFTETIDVTPTAAGASGELAFNFAQFNTALGMLNSVELILTPTFGDFGYSVYNSSSTPQTVSFAQVSNPQGTLSSAIGLNATWSSSESYQQDNFTANPGYNNGSLPFNSFAVTPSSVTVGAAGFVGAGTYDLVVNGSSVATSAGSPGSTLFYGWYGDVGGTLQVDYNYSTVPEPSTKFAGLSALGFLLVTLHRKFLKHFSMVG